MKKATGLLLIISLFLFSGCSTLHKLFPNAEQKQKNQQDKVEKTEKNIQQATDKINDKGKAFIYGAELSNLYETNRTPAIDTSLHFIKLAEITYGNPSMEDASTIRQITDGLMEQYKIDNAKLKEEVANAKLAMAKTSNETKSAKNELEQAKTELEEAKILKANAEKKLLAFQGDIIKLQKDKDLQIKSLAKQNDDLQKINEDNASKAAKWDEENGFWASLNPFTDLFKFIKKLATLTLIGGVLFGIFKILEIFFPELNVLGAFGSIVVKVGKFLVPKAISGAGLISSSVKNVFQDMVSATEKSLNVIENHDIESDLIANYPAEYKFSKDEVYRLLQSLSEKIEGIIKSNLVASQKDPTKADLVQQAKINLGIKNGTPT